MKKRARTVLIVLLSIVGGFAVLFFAFTFSFGIPRQDYGVGRIEPSRVGDGSYVGEYRIVAPFGTFVGNRRVKVQVEVKGGRIQGISVLSPEGARELLAPYAEQVIGRQSLEVDVVSAASWTPRAFLKAVETALQRR